MKRAILNPLAMGSRGRYVLLDGIQDNANLEDIVRHFDGFALMGNPVTLVREVPPRPPCQARPFLCLRQGAFACMWSLNGLGLHAAGTWRKRAPILAACCCQT